MFGEERPYFRQIFGVYCTLLRRWYDYVKKSTIVRIDGYQNGSPDVVDIVFCRFTGTDRDYS